MGVPHTGGCQCGRVRYEIRGEPLTLYCCHCTECQRQPSSAFGMSMPVRSGDVVVRGETREWRRRADSGNEVVCRFCPECGTRLFHEPKRNPAVVNVKPGTLDVTRWLRPVGHLPRPDPAQARRGVRGHRRENAQEHPGARARVAHPA